MSRKTHNVFILDCTKSSTKNCKNFGKRALDIIMGRRPARKPAMKLPPGRVRRGSKDGRNSWIEDEVPGPIDMNHPANVKENESQQKCVDAAATHAKTYISTSRSPQTLEALALLSEYGNAKKPGMKFEKVVDARKQVKEKWKAKKRVAEDQTVQEPVWLSLLSDYRNAKKPRMTFDGVVEARKSIADRWEGKKRVKNEGEH